LARLEAVLAGYDGSGLRGRSSGMAVTQRASLTLEQFLELPEEKPALEYFEGEVTQKVWPGGRHSCLRTAMMLSVNEYAELRKLALALPELQATYGGASTVPDISVYRWERIPRSASGEIADDFFEPPDIAIEIVSPTQSVIRLLRRCLWYVGNGVQIALLVDPSDRSVSVFRPGAQPTVLGGTDWIELDEVLPRFELTVQELFDSLKVE
jgi:Uma2 family endonuclease